MSTKPETPEAFVNRVHKEATDDAFELDEHAFIEMVRQRDELIASAAFDAGRVGVDELMGRIVSLEAQLATARDGIEKLEANAVRLNLQIGLERGKHQNAGDRIHCALIAIAARRPLGFIERALTGMPELLTSPPPRVDGWIPLASGNLPPLRVRVAVWWSGELREGERYNDHGEWLISGFGCTRELPTFWLSFPMSAPPTQPAAGTEETP